MPDQLTHIHGQLTQGLLPLTVEDLGSIRLANMITSELVSGEEAALQLAPGMQIQQTADSLQFQAIATNVFGFLDLPMKVLFFLHNDQLECLLSAVMPAGWNFRQSYPDLPDYQHFTNGIARATDSFFYQLKFAVDQPTRLLFSSYDFQADQSAAAFLTQFDSTLAAPSIKPGPNFMLNLGLDSIPGLDVLLQFVQHQQPTLAGTGYLELQPNGDSFLKLVFELPFTHQFENTFEIGISSLVFYSSVSRKIPRATAGIVFIGGLGFDPSDHPPRNVEITWPIGTTQLVIQNGEPIPFPSFDTFANLLPDHLPNQQSNGFPVETASLSDLFIREISFHLSAIAPPTLSFLTFSVGPPQDWNLDFLNGAIGIEDLLLRWDIFFGGGNNKVDFYLFGAFLLGGGQVNASAVFPDFVFQGELAPYQTINLSAILQHFLPDANLPEVDILDFSLQADFKQKIYNFEIDIATDWKIELGQVSILPLKDLRINLEKSEGSTFVNIDCMVAIGGVDLVVMAANSGQAPSGWQLRGSTGRGQAIPIGELIGELAQKFGGSPSLPATITQFELRNLDLEFNTASKDFRFAGEANFPLNEDYGSQVDILVNIDIKHQLDGSFTRFFSGQMMVGLSTTTLELDLLFDQKSLVVPPSSAPTNDQTPNPTAPDSNTMQEATFLALFQDTEGLQLEIDEILKAFEITEVQTGLSFTLKEMLVAYQQSNNSLSDPNLPGTANGKWLFGIDIEGGLNLSAIHIDDLPFVSIPPDQTLKLDFQVLAASKPFTLEEVQTLSSLAPGGNLGFPSKAIEKVDLSVTLDLGTTRKQIDLPIGLQTAAGGSPAPANSGLVPAAQANSSTPQSNTGVTATGQDGVRWITLQKQLGPLAFERIGVKYADSQVQALLDASFSVGGLTIALNGLSVSSPISKFEPTFGLNGLGIDFKNASVEIGGTFLKEPNGFAGMAVIRTEAISLSAIGAYAYADGEPSLFLYAVLDYPFGGPAFFFVTGVAAGFGYNRRLLMPGIEQVATFPLVLEATRSSAAGDTSPLPTDQQGRSTTLQQEIQALDQYIPIDNGQYFLAVGLKFTSFKQIDSFALLVVQFGNRFEIDLLGLSTLKVPSLAEGGVAVTPVAEAQLALKAVFIPSEGFLGVQAQLTSNAYILSRACRLTGGFAFFSWFAGQHNGDFVLSLGGYHPAFKVPDHYPQVPRLGFAWVVSPQFFLRGELYFALTANALMAGGRLDALFQTDNIKAWFSAGADFLIAWKPYHYEIAVFISMGLDISFEFFGTQHITLSAAADLKLWGPEFGGEAHIKVKVLFFTIPVDIAFGSRAPAIPAINFTEFKQSYLPAEESQVCSVAIQTGLIETVTENGEEIWVVNAKEMVLVTNSSIPSSQCKLFGSDLNWDGGKIAVQPMGVRSDEITTTHEISISGMAADDIKGLTAIPVAKKVPAALWGQPEFAAGDPFRQVNGQRYIEKPQINGERFVEDTLAGYEIRVGKRPPAGVAHPVAKEALKSQIMDAPEKAFWQRVELKDSIGAMAWQAAATTDRLVRNTERDELLAALGLSQLAVDFGEPTTQYVAT